MNKIGFDGVASTELFGDFSLFSLNNINIGQYAAKIIQGSNNTILGQNAGKLAVKVNESIFIGSDVATNIKNGTSNISIGNDNSLLENIDKSINIGYNTINSDNSITIGNNLINNNLINIGYETSQLKIGNSNISFNSDSIQIGDIINLGFNSYSNTISIGNYNSNININIGTSNISPTNNSIIIGNNINNSNKYSLNIDNLICKYQNDDSKIIYLGVANYKNIPIIIGSVNNNDNNNNNNNDNNNNDLLIKGSLNTNKIIIKNNSNLAIAIKSNHNLVKDIIYYLPTIPKNIGNLFLSVGKNGILQWKEITNDMITTIITRGDFICNNIDAELIQGFGYFLNNINISDKTTDELKEGINNLYFNTRLISELLLSTIEKITTDTIKGSLTSNIYYNEILYSSNFTNHLSNLTTDDIKTCNSRFYLMSDYYEYSLNNLLNIDTNNLKEGKSNLYYSENVFNKYSNSIISNLKEGSSNLYFTNNRFQNVFNSYINTNGIKNITEGNSNLYYNSLNVESNTSYLLNLINSDFFSEGKTNLYYTNNRVETFFNSNLQNTDIINEGSSNLYFKSISNIEINTNFIRQGFSNIYYQGDSNLKSRISVNSTTDIFKQGSSNIYLNESNIISQFQGYLKNNITTDNITEKNNYRFITNNYYNSPLNINGFIKANNVSLNNNSNVDIDINKIEILKDEFSIGPLTEVIHVYDYNEIYFNNKLSNIDIKLNYENSNYNSNVPFIVIQDKVGINNINPRFNLHMGTGNDEAFLSKIRISDTKGIDGDYGVILMTSNNETNNGDDFIIKTRKEATEEFKKTIIIKNNSFVGIGNNNPQAYLHLNSSDIRDISIKMTDDITGHSLSNGFSLSKNENNDGIIWNYENGNLRFGTNNQERFKIDNNGNSFLNVPDSYNYNLLGYNQKLTLGGSGNGNTWGQFYIYDNSITDNNYLGLIIRADNINNYCFIQSDKKGINTNVPLLLNPRGENSIGIGLYNPIEKLHVNGNIVASGNIISSFSDMRLKTKTGDLNNSLDIISKLNGFKYKLNETAVNLGLCNDNNNKEMIGLNALEVNEIIPEVISIAPFDMKKNDENEIISKSGNNYLSIQYDRIIPYLIEAIKELKKEIEILKLK